MAIWHRWRGTEIWHNENSPVPTLLVSSTDASWDSVSNHMVPGGLTCNIIVSVEFVLAVV